MALEDTIRTRLFGSYARRLESIPNENSSFVIECKAEHGKPVPLCMPADVLSNSHVVYRQLWQTNNSIQEERASARAMYNFIFGSQCWTPLSKLKVKDSIYYTAYGTLFNADKELLFYFAREYNDDMTVITPRLYITPTLLHDASRPSKYMEKFFMSTVVPFLIDNDVWTHSGYKRTIIEIDNHADEVFFYPSSNLINAVPVGQVNDTLNDILADNADVLSTFIDNYKNR